MRYFLEKRITAYMLFAGLFIFGLAGLSRLPVSLMPQASRPGISVIIEYPGISPEKIESIITRPVEKILKTVPGIETIDSVSEEGRSRINVCFGMDSDIRIAVLKIRERMGLIRDDFPRSVQEPVVVRYDPSDKPVLIAAFEKKGATLPELRELVERRYKPRLQRIEGVSEVDVAGGLTREVHVDVDAASFSARSLSFGKLLRAIQAGNVSLPGGLLGSGGREYLVTVPGRYRSVPEIAETALAGEPGGALIRLSDFSEVREAYRDREDIARLDGAERVMVYVQRAGDANIASVCGEAERLLAGVKDCEARIVYNQGSYIRAAMGNVVSSCIWGALIVVLVVYAFFRRPVPVIVISLSIPLSIVTVFAFMHFARTGIDVMSLCGLALGSGMVIDISIIVTDSILARGRGGIDSIYRGAAGVRNAVIASTLTNIIVFLPIVFGDSLTRRMYGGMAFTISCALATSLVVAIVLVPAAYASLSGRRFPGSINPSRFLSGRVMVRLKRLPAGMERVESILRAIYERALDYSFARPGRILAGLGVLFIIALVMSMLIKSEFVDPMGSGEFYAYLEFPAGTPLARMDSLVSRAEERLRSMGCTKRIGARVEKWRGTLAVSLQDSLSSGRKRERAKGRIQKELNGLLQPHGAFAFLSEADEADSRELSIALLGDDNELLRNLARGCARRIGSVPGIEECVLRFRESRPSCRLHVDRGKAGASGISPFEIADFFHSALYGPVAAKLVDVDREVDVRVRFRDEQRRTMDQLLSCPIRSEGGDMVPARELVDVKESTEPSKIWRRNGRRCVYITARIGSLSFEEAARRIDSALQDLRFPPEYSYEYDETLARVKKSRGEMAALAVLSALLVFMVLAVLFESLVAPIVIMATVPLSLIGVMFALFLTGASLNISVYIGIIILIGIVVNNGIVLVDAFRQGTGRSRGDEELRRRIKKICMAHLRPVVSTSLTNCAGVLPALFAGGEGSNLWRPVSLTIVSGLSFATLLTLIVIPLAYWGAQGLRLRYGERIHLVLRRGIRWKTRAS